MSTRTYDCVRVYLVVNLSRKCLVEIKNSTHLGNMWSSFEKRDSYDIIACIACIHQRRQNETYFTKKNK